MSLLVPSPEIFAVKFLFNPNPIAKLVKSLPVSRNGDRFGIRTSAVSGDRIGVQGREVRVTQLNRDMNLYGQFPVEQETKQSHEEEEEKQDYYVNMGYAIRTLREGFPELFFRELSFDIYRDGIVFRNPLNTFVGIETINQSSGLYVSMERYFSRPYGLTSLACGNLWGMS